MPFRNEAKVIQCNEGRLKDVRVVTSFQATVGHCREALSRRNQFDFGPFVLEKGRARLHSSCTGLSRNYQLLLIYWVITGLWGMGSFLMIFYWFVFHRDILTSPAQDASDASNGPMGRKTYLFNVMLIR